MDKTWSLITSLWMKQCTVETDVCVWRYALLVVLATQEDVCLHSCSKSSRLISSQALKDAWWPVLTFMICLTYNKWTALTGVQSNHVKSLNNPRVFVYGCISVRLTELIAVVWLCCLTVMMLLMVSQLAVKCHPRCAAAAGAICARRSHLHCCSSTHGPYRLPVLVMTCSVPSVIQSLDCCVSQYQNPVRLEELQARWAADITLWLLHANKSQCESDLIKSRSRRVLRRVWPCIWCFHASFYPILDSWYRWETLARIHIRCLVRISPSLRIVAAWVNCTSFRQPDSVLLGQFQHWLDSISKCCQCSYSTLVNLFWSFLLSDVGSHCFYALYGSTDNIHVMLSQPVSSVVLSLLMDVRLCAHLSVCLAVF